MQEEVPRYGGIDRAIEERIDDLLGRMTLAEKVGQLVQVTPAAVSGLEEKIRAGSVGSLLSEPDRRKINRYQRLAVEESRLGIPLIVGNDVVHGLRTVFPIPLAASCSWDLPLVEEAARVAA